MKLWEKEEGHDDIREEKRRIKQTKTRQEEDGTNGMTKKEERIKEEGEKEQVKPK